MPRIIAVLACFVATAFAENADWRFIHPDAKVFIGVKVHRVMQSRLAADFEGQMTGLSFPEVAGFPGTDLFRDVDDVFLSSPGPAADAGPESQPPLLLRITGRFDPQKVEAFFRESGAHLQMYLKHRVFRHKGDGDMAATLIDPHTLLVGDAPSLFAALERMDWSADATPRNPLLARALELDATSDLWAVFAVAPSSFTQLPQLPSLDDVHGMEVAANLGEGIVLHLALKTDSPDSAAKLAASLNQLLLLAMKTQASSPDVAALGRNLHFGVDEASVRLQVTIPGQEIRKALAGMHREMAKGQMAALAHAPAAPVASQPPPPPEHRVIRIEGLDGGPKEIPYN